MDTDKNTKPKKTSSHITHLMPALFLLASVHMAYGATQGTVDAGAAQERYAEIMETVK